MIHFLMVAGEKEIADTMFVLTGTSVQNVAVQ
nr:MAG TPA: hypothetical protein [Siphoviridae sp. ctEup56]